MKFFIVFACSLAMATAGHILAPQVHQVHAAGYHGPQHLPIIDHEGVPVDTADVQIAKNAHLAHKINVAARNGDLAIGHHVSPVVSAYAVPAISHSAVVAHTAPVLAHSGHGAVAPVVSGFHGVLSHHGLLYRKRRGIYAAAPQALHHGYYGAQHIPLINQEGVPVDTADVQIARAAHLAHKVNVHNRNGDHAVLAYSAPILAAPPTTYAHAPIVTSHGLVHSAPLAHYY